MFFDPLTGWLVALIANGIVFSNEKLKQKQADIYLKNKPPSEYLQKLAQEEEEKKKYPEPHRNERGQIIIENNLLYQEDLKKYGASQTYKWVRQGKYNLTPEELEKEHKRLEEKYKRKYGR